MSTSITSDRDYLEILDDDDVTISTGDSDTDAEAFNTVYAGTDYGVYTVTHNLGYVPLVRAFYDPNKNGTLYNTRRINGTGYGQFDEPWLTTVSNTTTTKLIISSNSAETDIPVYYRIYRFGTKGETSDERIDKIFSTEDSLPTTLAAAADSVTPSYTTLTIPQSMGESVLNTLQFSEDNATWYSGGTALYGGPDTGSGPPGGPYSFYYYTTAYGYADDTNFYVFLQHNYSTEKTIYVRYALDLKA